MSFKKDILNQFFKVYFSILSPSIRIVWAPICITNSFLPVLSGSEYFMFWEGMKKPHEIMTGWWCRLGLTKGLEVNRLGMSRGRGCHAPSISFYKSKNWTKHIFSRSTKLIITSCEMLKKNLFVCFGFGFNNLFMLRFVLFYIHWNWFWETFIVYSLGHGAPSNKRHLMCRQNQIENN